MNSYKIAVIPGDGIGKEVVPEGIRVLEAAGSKFGVAFHWDFFPWSCEYYAQHGRMMPGDGLAQIRHHDAIFLGAVGFPGVPDHVSLWGLLIPIRRQFQQYVNLRPVRLMPGIRSPLADRKPGDIDFWVVRENNEGEYSSIGGRFNEGTQHELVVQESIFTRRGVDRILRYAFELARSRPKHHLTSATKSNGISITMPYWDERFKALAADYPAVKTDQFHIDILSAHFVQHPDWFDVVEQTSGTDKKTIQLNIPEGRTLAIEGSLLVLLRFFPYDSTTRWDLFMIDFSGKSITATARQAGIERITVPAGEFSCYRMEVLIHTFILSPTIVCWVTTEKPHFVVKNEGKRGIFTPKYTTTLIGKQWERVAPF